MIGDIIKFVGHTVEDIGDIIFYITDKIMR